VTLYGTYERATKRAMASNKYSSLERHQHVQRLQRSLLKPVSRFGARHNFKVTSVYPLDIFVEHPGGYAGVALIKDVILVDLTSIPKYVCDDPGTLTGSQQL